MMHLAIFGLGAFARSLLEALRPFSIEITLLDQDEKLISAWRPYANYAICVDLNLRLEWIRHLPEKLDVAVIDLGADSTTAVKLAHYIKQSLSPDYLVVVSPDQELVDVYRELGVNDVVVPNNEAALRVLPFLISRHIFSYIPISRDFVMAEIELPSTFHGKTLRQLNLRSQYGLNVVAIRRGEGDFELFDIDLTLSPTDKLLVVARTEDLNVFLAGKKMASAKSLSALMEMLFRRG